MREEAKLMIAQERPGNDKQGRPRDRGSIVNISSGAGTVGIAQHPA